MGATMLASGWLAMRISPLVLAFLLLVLPSFALAQPEDAASPEPESQVEDEGKQQTGASATGENTDEEQAPVREFRPTEEIMADTELTLPADI